MRPTPSTTTLIEQHDAVDIRIEEPPMPRCTPRAGTTVWDDSRLAPGIAAHLPVDEITTSDLEHAVRIRFDLGIQVWPRQLELGLRAIRLMKEM